MAGRQESGGVTGQMHWILAAILMLWSHQIGGQGQGLCLGAAGCHSCVTVMSSRIFPVPQ
ncbi:hypothetical protein N325_04614, partial [Colius striatus]